MSETEGPAGDARADEGTELVRLASADNFRDIAGTGEGYPTAGGGHVRRGEFYRSNEINLHADELDRIATLGITAVYDLRDDAEVESHPSHAVPGSERRHLAVKGIPMDAVSHLTSVAEGTAVMQDVYRRFVERPDTRASYAELLTRLAETAGPQLFHCTAGKDRTGWATELLLHLAGVDPDTRLADYLLTNDVSQATRAKYLGMVADHLGQDAVEVYERVMVADEAYLQAARDAVTASYGDLDGYLTDGLGLSPDTISALRDRLRG